MGAAAEEGDDRHIDRHHKRPRRDSRSPERGGGGVEHHERSRHDRSRERRRGGSRERSRERSRSRERRRGGSRERSRSRERRRNGSKERSRERRRGGSQERGGRHRGDDLDRPAPGHHRDRDGQRGGEGEQPGRWEGHAQPDYPPPPLPPLHGGGGGGRDGPRPAGGGSQQLEPPPQSMQAPRPRGRGRRGDNEPSGKQRWGKPEEWAEEEAAEAAAKLPKEGPNLGLSGKLAAESNRTADGTRELKYQPPPEARVCKKPPWRLYVFKGDAEAAPPIALNQTPFYLFGKDRKVADIPTDHPSCSRQHAVIVFREVEVDAPDGLATRRVVKPYLLDLESVNGTTINGERVEPARYYELLTSDVVRFGLSSRDYVVVSEAAV